MPWTNAPINGNISVKANEAALNSNADYINTTMKVDHFWNDAPNSGHHNYVNMMKQASDPIPSLDGILFLKEDGTSVNSVQGYYRNAVNTYEVFPAYITGSVSVTSESTFAIVTSVPANVVGEIIFYRKTDNATPNLSKAYIQKGNFYSNNNTVHAYSNRIKEENTSTDYLLELANVNTTDLNIKVRRESSSSATWNYQITYRAV